MERCNHPVIVRRALAWQLGVGVVFLAFCAAPASGVDATAESVELIERAAVHRPSSLSDFSAVAERSDWVLGRLGLGQKAVPPGYGFCGARAAASGHLEGLDGADIGRHRESEPAYPMADHPEVVEAAAAAARAMSALRRERSPGGSPSVWDFEESRLERRAAGATGSRITAPAHGQDCQSENAAPVRIPDSNLRAAIEVVLGKAAGEVVTRAEMSTITRLSAPWSRIADLQGLQFAACLEDLELPVNRIGGVSPVSGLERLRRLDLRGNRIANVDPLADLAGLETLWLSYNDIADAAPLRGLTGLESLSLSRNRLDDISPLAGLAALKALYVSRNNIGDISTLAGMNDMRTLYLQDNRIGDLAPLAGMAGLETLYLADNVVGDISPLAGLQALRIADLSRNAIADLAPLAANPGMGAGDRVEVSHNPLTADSIRVHLVVLADRGVTLPIDIPDPRLRAAVNAQLGKTARATVTAPELASVQALAAAGVEDLRGLEFATHIWFLSIHESHLSDFGPVAGLTSLAGLGITNSGVVDISSLAGLSALHTLWLGGNDIVDIAPLARLTKLRELRLVDNSVRDVSPLADLNRLSRLDLNDNEVADIAPLAELVALRDLSLRNNVVSDITPLAGLAGLEILWVSYNRIADISPLACSRTSSNCPSPATGSAISRRSPAWPISGS